MELEPNEFQGTRLASTPISELPDDIVPGAYWLVLQNYEMGKYLSTLKSDEDSNLTGLVWMVAAPMSYGYAIGRLTKHTVRENRDRTISVLPGDGSSNSILITGHDNEQYHGYIYRGIWRSC